MGYGVCQYQELAVLESPETVENMDQECLNAVFVASAISLEGNLLDDRASMDSRCGR